MIKFTPIVKKKWSYTETFAIFLLQKGLSFDWDMLEFVENRNFAYPRPKNSASVTPDTLTITPTCSISASGICLV